MNYLRGQGTSPLKRSVREADEAGFSELQRFAASYRMAGLQRLLDCRRRSRRETLDAPPARQGAGAWMAQGADQVPTLS